MLKLVKEGGIYTVEAFISSKQNNDLYEKAILVFDPGCAATLMDTTFMELLGYSASRHGTRKSSLDGACGVSKGFVVEVESFKCLGHEQTNFEVACHDLSSSLGVVGLLGMNFLEKFRLDINFKEGLIHNIERLD